MRPELLAVRAINQYRRRDIIAYLGLRYYLENCCALSDRWMREVSSYLVDTRSSPYYFCSCHFKETTDDDSVVYRKIYIPGPNEILAETALLYECSAYPAFGSLPCVYSYYFPEPNSKEGVFRSYFPGFRNRHDSIAEVCASLSSAMVRYTDIRKFYPTISHELALTKWTAACDASDISSVSRELGERLLADHTQMATADGEGLSVLVGPMFSHLIANLVLSEIDRIMSAKMEGRYWRYVDDIVLVGTAEQTNDGRKLLDSILSDSDLGFSLHTEGKDFLVDSDAWLEGIDDFDSSEGMVWINLLADVKRFLISKPKERVDLVRAFSANGISIPLRDYSGVVTESSYLERLSDWLAKYLWSLRLVRGLTVRKLVESAIRARNVYQNRIDTLLDKTPELSGYARKRLITKLRFYAGRLIFLAPPDVLSATSSALTRYPELLLHSSVMRAIQSRDVSSLLRLGTNAVQAAAQILRIQHSPVKCSLGTFDGVELQGLAIVRLNGIRIDFADNVIGKTIADPLNEFALGLNTPELMKSSDLFIQELACLRGTKDLLRHQSILDTAFDRDEQLILDVTDQLHESSCF